MGDIQRGLTFLGLLHSDVALLPPVSSCPASLTPSFVLGLGHTFSPFARKLARRSFLTVLLGVFFPTAFHLLSYLFCCKPIVDFCPTVLRASHMCCCARLTLRCRPVCLRRRAGCDRIVCVCARLQLQLVTTAASSLLRLQAEELFVWCVGFLVPCPL